MTTEQKICSICGDTFFYHPSGYVGDYYGISLNNQGVCPCCIKEFIDLKREKNLPIRKYSFRYKEVYDSALMDDIRGQIEEYQEKAANGKFPRAHTVLAYFVGGNDATAEEFKVVRNQFCYIYHRNNDGTEKIFKRMKFDIINNEFSNEPNIVKTNDHVIPVSSYLGAIMPK
jgi:hypothetical protein